MQKSKLDHHLIVRGGVYYIIAQRTLNGRRQRLSRSTGIKAGEPSATKSRQDARQMRDAVLRVWRNERTDLLNEIKMRIDAARLADLSDTYLRIVDRHGRPRPATARNNASSLRTVVRNAGKDPDRECVNVLNRQLVVKYTENVLENADDEITAQITINSTLRQARSMFKRSLVGEYEQRLLPADLAGFLTQFACVDPMASKARDDPPPTKEEMQPLIAAGAELIGTPLYPLWLLNYYLAMRASEILNCRWSWFETDEYGRPAINIKARPGYTPKGRARSIPIAPDVMDMLRGCLCKDDYIEFSSDRVLIDVYDDYVLAGHPHADREKLIREYNTWIKGFGWDRKKKSHAIRAYRIEQWRRAYGLDVAKDWGGHVSRKTTATHYAGNTHAEAPLPATE